MSTIAASVVDACISFADVMAGLGRSKPDTSPSLPTQNSLPPRSVCQSPNNMGSIGWPARHTPSDRPSFQTGLNSNSQLPSWSALPAGHPPARRLGGSLIDYKSLFRGKQGMEDVERGSKSTAGSFEVTRKPGSDEADRLLEEGRRFGGETCGR